MLKNKKILLGVTGGIAAYKSCELIRLYQKYISPIKATKCPYYPCCSQYGLEAVEKHGALKGGFLAAWRILRCNPFSRGGYDPVP